MLETIARLAAGLVLVVANAYFVATEFALTRVRQYPKSEFEGHPSLRRAWEMTERLEIHLTGCQVGITLTSILLGVVAEPAVTALLAPLFGLLEMAPGTSHLISIVLAVLIINLVHTVYGEQVPTYLGVERPRFIARYLAPGLHWWTKTLYPLIRFGDWAAKATLRPFGIRITRSWTTEEGTEEDGEIHDPAELRSQIGELLTRGSLPADRRREVLRALEIGSIPVAEIMTPIGDVATLSSDGSLEEHLEVVAERQHVRFPILNVGTGRYEGAVYVPQLLARLDGLRDGSERLLDLATPLVRVRADQAVSQVIDELQANDQELALVEEGAEVVGLVTITDTFEAIAGELRDPFD